MLVVEVYLYTVKYIIVTYGLIYYSVVVYICSIKGQNYDVYTI